MNNLLMFAQTETQSQTGCTLNGQPIDCGELADKAAPFLGIGIGLIVLFVILSIVVFVYWLLMLLHAIRHNSPDRTLWIVVLVVSLLMGLALIGAVVYHLAEKKKAEQAGQPPVSPMQSPASPQAPQPPEPPQPPQPPTGP